MIELLVTLGVLAGMGALFFLIGASFAYGDGKMHAQRPNYFGSTTRYANGYWLIWAWAYDLGFNRGTYLKDNPKTTVEEKNKARREARLTRYGSDTVVEDAPVAKPESKLRRYFK